MLSNRFERRLIAVGAFLFGIYDLLSSAFPRVFEQRIDIEGTVPVDAINGSRFLLVLIGLTLVISSRALWHGKRSAWWIAVACAIGSVFAHPLRNVDLWGVGGSLLLLGALVGARPQFPARNDPPSAVKGLILAGVGVVIVLVYATIGLYFLDHSFRQPVGFLDSAEDALRLLFIVPTANAEPITRHGHWFLTSVRVASLFVIALGVSLVLQPVVYRRRTTRLERIQVGSLLRRFADSTLAYFALQPDKSYFFSTTGNSVLAFKIVGNTAIVMGDPIGDPVEFEDLIRQFRQQCDLDVRAFAFHQVRADYLPIYRACGLKALKIGEEGFVDIQGFTLSGQAMKHVRATMNRFEREGYRAEVLQPPHDEQTMETLRHLSDAWLEKGGNRERTFVVGYFDAAVLANEELMVVRSSTGEIVGFANILPSYRSRDANFDLLRHGREPKDVSDFLHVSLITHFREQGFERMTLGLAPLSGIETERAIAPVQAFMQLLYRYGSTVFRFRGLREFKEKFATEWEPRFLIYARETELTGIAMALARVGELPSAGAGWRSRWRRSSGIGRGSVGDRAGQVKGPQLLGSSAPEQ